MRFTPVALVFIVICVAYVQSGLVGKVLERRIQRTKDAIERIENNGSLLGAGKEAAKARLQGLKDWLKKLTGGKSDDDKELDDLLKEDEESRKKRAADDDDVDADDEDKDPTFLQVQLKAAKKFLAERRAELKNVSGLSKDMLKARIELFKAVVKNMRARLNKALGRNVDEDAAADE